MVEKDILILKRLLRIRVFLNVKNRWQKQPKLIKYEPKPFLKYSIDIKPQYKIQKTNKLEIWPKLQLFKKKKIFQKLLSRKPIHKNQCYSSIK